MSKKSAYCISASEAQASEIVIQLKLAGFSSDDISALLPDKTGTKDFAFEHHTKAPEGAAAGVLIGGVVCAGLGLLASSGLLAIPAASPLVAAGPVIGALSAGAVGAGIGGILGALAGCGVPEYEAKRFAGKIREGKILISVHCESSSAAKRAKVVFERARARAIAISNEAKVKSTAPAGVPSPAHTGQDSSSSVGTELNLRFVAEGAGAESVPYPSAETKRIGSKYI